MVSMTERGKSVRRVPVFAPDFPSDAGRDTPNLPRDFGLAHVGEKGSALRRIRQFTRPWPGRHALDLSVLRASSLPHSLRILYYEILCMTRAV